MDTIIQFIFLHSQYAHLLIFGLLILAGFNLPVSEDLMIIITAILASTVLPGKFLILFISMYLGCYLSDLIVYWIGRKLGKKLWKYKWFNKTVSPKKLEKTQNFYSQNGFLTLIIGRFIPFGVRNCLFLIAGFSKMPFKRFALIDGIACLLSNTTLFTFVYFLGKNYQAFHQGLKKFHIILFSFFILTLISFYRFYKIRTKKRDQKEKVK